LRRQVSFDRLLARLFSEPNAPWLLKGGYAMELRLRTARTTKDIDLSLPVDATSEGKARVLEHLQAGVAKDLKDFFVFTIGQPMMDLDAAPEGGARYPVTASLAGRVFTKFHLDVGMGDAAIEPTELLEGRNWLGFAGIYPTKFVAISKEQQFAEKLHAYTLPRLEGTNSRVKDVVDMVLLLRLGTLDLERLREAIRTTFALRETHVLPVVLPEHRRHILLSLLGARRGFARHPGLGHPAPDERERRGDRHPAGAGGLPASAAPDHYRQWAAVHRQGLQGVHPALADYSCPLFSPLPAEQRQTGTLPPHPQGAGHPAQDAAHPRRCKADRRGLYRP